MRKHQLPLFIVITLAGALLTIGQAAHDSSESTSVTGGQGTSHVMVTPDQLKWGAAPPSLPPGAQLAVLEGDPSKAGPFTIRAKFPDGYRVAPHWHPTDERVVVIEGTLAMGLGEKFDPAVAHELSVGSFALMPKGVRHFASAKGATIIQVSGIGPFEINYVNSADDPRTASKQAN